MVGPPSGVNVGGGANQPAASTLPPRIASGRRITSRRGEMFEPLGESDTEKSTGTRRGTRAIWIVVTVVVIALAALSFM
jgi:hypothetical protein